MKKYLFLFLITGISHATSAQIHFGLKAGLNRASLNYSGSGINDLGVRYNFNAGVFASAPLFSHFFLQPELFYSGQGSGPTDTIPVTTIYNYANLPVLIKYQHPSGLFAETGPQFGLLYSAHLLSNGESLNVRSYTQSTDFSWVLGIGYKISAINLGIDIRYNYGLSNTVPKYGIGTAKNSVFQFDLFYEFGNL